MLVVIYFKRLQVAVMSSTLRSLLDEKSISSDQGRAILGNHLSKQAELSEQGGIFLEHCLASRPKNCEIIFFQLGNKSNNKRK